MVIGGLPKITCSVVLTGIRWCIMDLVIKAQNEAARRPAASSCNTSQLSSFLTNYATACNCVFEASSTVILIRLNAFQQVKSRIRQQKV